MFVASTGVVVVVVAAVVDEVVLVEVELADDVEGDVLLSLPPHAVAKTVSATAKGTKYRTGDRSMMQSWTPHLGCARSIGPV